MGDATGVWPPPIEAKQSITEVLQNPRGELRDSLDFRGAPPPPPPPSAPPDAAVTINDFADYLRDLAPLYDEAPLDVPVTGDARAQTLADVPPAYYAPTFGVAASEDLAGVLATAEGGALDQRRVAECRAGLVSREDALRAELQAKLRERADQVDEALAEVRLLRARVLSAAREVSDARERAHSAVGAVARPVTRIADVVAARANALAVLQTLRMVKRVRAAAGDVPVLLDTGQYAAAIDSVHSARDALQSVELRGVHALAAARARLARAVESIDARLRADFRQMTRTDEAVDEAQVLAVADLCARIGRMEVLRTTYLDDTATALAKELETCKDVSVASSIVRARVAKAAKVLHALHGDEDSSRSRALNRLFSDAQECLCAVLDRLLASFPVADDASTGAYIVLQSEENVTEVSCFDEAKAAIRFTELMRSLNSLADDVAREIGVEPSVGGPLRTKCRERVLAFIDAFHKAHVDAVTETVRADEWKEVAVPEGTSRLVLSVAISEDSAPPPQPQQPSEAEGAERAEGRVAGPIQTPQIRGRGKPKRLRVPLVVNGVGYYSVRSGLRFARSLCAYALLVDKIPLVASAAARRGVELSILFNSLVCQAILGAAALEWAGIKTITARHLALASRTVAVAHLLSGAVHEALKAAVPEAQLTVVQPLMHKATEEFSDSRRQLLAKILTIMMQRLSAHEATCKSLPWAKKGDMNRLATPSPYMDRLCLESELLHRILWQILPSDEVGVIFHKVCNAFASRLDAVYESCDRSKPWVSKRITADCSHLFSKLLKLDVFDANPDVINPIKALFKKYSEEPETSNEGNGTAERGSPRNVEQTGPEPPELPDPPIIDNALMSRDSEVIPRVEADAALPPANNGDDEVHPQPNGIPSSTDNVPDANTDLDGSLPATAENGGQESTADLPSSTPVDADTTTVLDGNLPPTTENADDDASFDVSLEPDRVQDDAAQTSSNGASAQVETNDIPTVTTDDIAVYGSAPTVTESVDEDTSTELSSEPPEIVQDYGGQSSSNDHEDVDEDDASGVTSSAAAAAVDDDEGDEASSTDGADEVSSAEVSSEPATTETTSELSTQPSLEHSTQRSGE